MDHFKPKTTDINATVRLSKQDHKRLVDYALAKGETIGAVIREAILKKLNAWK